MSRANLNIKRELLTDLFEGKVDKLRSYRANQQRINSPYQCIIQDEVAGTLYGIDRNGNQHPLTMADLAQAPPTSVIRIADFTDGKRVPEIDEDYNEGP